MKDKQVETSSSSSSEDEEEDEDDDDDEEDSSEDDQSSSSTSDLDKESIKLINKVEKMIQRLNVKGVPSKSKISFSPIKEMSKERMLWMRRVGALCRSLSKQAHTQDKEEGMQEPSSHINKVMGWFFKWRRTPSQEARPQALIIKLFSYVPYGTR